MDSFRHRRHQLGGKSGVNFSYTRPRGKAKKELGFDDNNFVVGPEYHVRHLGVLGTSSDQLDLLPIGERHLVQVLSSFRHAAKLSWDSTLLRLIIDENCGGAVEVGSSRAVIPMFLLL